MKMRSQNIETIKKRYHRQWLLIALDEMDESTTTPVSGRLIFHSPHRDDAYRKLLSLKRRWPILIACSEDTMPKGFVAAFLSH